LFEKGGFRHFMNQKEKNIDRIGEGRAKEEDE